MYIPHTKSFNIPVSIAINTLAHMINVYEICLNTTNYPIFNMQDFRYCLWTCILDCFCQLVSPPCFCMSFPDGHTWQLQIYWTTDVHLLWIGTTSGCIMFTDWARGDWATKELNDSLDYCPAWFEQGGWQMM